MLHHVPRCILTACVGLCLSACLMTDTRRGMDAAPAGHVSLSLSLERPSALLLKASATDTIFSLDSLVIILTAASSDTLEHRIALAGRADTGNIALPELVFELPALRNWKATIYSIDQVDSIARDTVHVDSVIFAVRPADTTAVAKTIAPAFSILRARFVSTDGDSIPDNVVYVRLRVNGVVRDSSMVGGKNAALRWVQALPGNVIFAAGDSGRILKSTNDAQPSETGSWIETVVTNEPLVGGHFPSSTHGYVVSISGKVFKTENAGGQWTQRVTTADSLNAVYFVTNAYGWAVGRNGGIYKTTNSANSWFGTMVSNTVQHLRGVHFPTSEIGFVVGEHETILRTKNGASGGDAQPQNSGVVWTPVAGGWFPQTSQETTRDFTDIVFSSENTGWAIGKNGLIRLTTNGGATWITNVGNPGNHNMNAIAYAGAWNRHFVVADNGVIIKSAGENDWRTQLGGVSGTTENLNDIVVVNGGDTAFVVGDKGKILRSTNASTISSPYVQWSSFDLPGPSDGPALPAWDSLNSSTTSALHAVTFGSASTGWAVGDGGVVRKTADSGKTWFADNSSGGTMYAVHAFPNGTDAIVVGAGGQARRSNNGGNWSDASSGLPARNLYGVGFLNSNVGWVVGDSGTIRATDGGGWHWGYSKDLGTTKYNAVSVNGSRVWIVGDGGKVVRSGNGGLGAGSSFESLTPPGGSEIGSKNLRGAHFLNGDEIGWIVGDSGLIVKVGKANANANSGQITWTKQHSGTTQSLRHVRFLDSDTGYVVGDSGLVLKTVDGGSLWTIQASGTTQNLTGVFPQSSQQAILVGASGTFRRTTTGGVSGSASANTQHLRAVHAVNSSRVFVVGDSGTIGKTTNAGASWTLVHKDSVPTLQNLHDIAFANANVGWAVGENGTILKTTNGGARWEAQASHTTRRLVSIAVRTPDTVYVTGEGGLILKTVTGGNGSNGWYQQESPTTQDFNQVYFYNSAKGWAVGKSGTIANAVNFGDNWTGGGIKRSLKGVYFASASTGWIVGNDGVILKTTDTGSTWKEQHRQAGLQLYGVHFVDANTGWATGEGGVILKTEDGGANWVPQTSHAGIDLHWVHFRDANRGFVIGGTESLLETSDGGGNWTSQFVGAPGLRVFDKLLAYKRLKPGVPHQVILDAVDRFTLPMRGYQSVFELTVGAGVDSTIKVELVRCGHVDSLPCVE